MAFVYVKISFSQSNGHNFLKISGRVRYLRPTPQKASKRAAIAYGIKHRQASCPNVPITSGLLINFGLTANQALRFASQISMTMPKRECSF